MLLESIRLPVVGLLFSSIPFYSIEFRGLVTLAHIFRERILIKKGPLPGFEPGTVRFIVGHSTDCSNYISYLYLQK